MSREARLVLIAALVVAVLAVVALALQLTPPTTETREVVFKAAAPSDVARIAIHNAQGTFEVVASDAGYAVADIPPELVDQDDLHSLLAHSAVVQALFTVSSAPRDLAPYGLAEPAARVEIAYADGSTLTLLLGHQERVTRNYYARVEGDSAVYLLAAERCEGFLLPKEAYIEELITPQLALSSPLSAILDVTFSGERLETPITVQAVATGDPEVRRAALSLGAPTHIVRGRGVYKLDQTYGIEIMGALLGLTAYDIVGYRLTPQEIAAFGFDQPTLKVEFDLKNGVNAPVEHYALAVLRRGDAYYLTCNDNGVIYAIPEPAFVHVEYEKLLVRWFLSPLLLDVRAVEIATGGEEYVFVLTGETNADKRVACNGQELDIERFRTLYRLLTSAAHDGALLRDARVQGPPLLRLTYHYRDEAKPPDVMILYKGDARRVFVEVNGVMELAMREMYLTRVQEALARLWSDAPIETDW